MPAGKRFVASAVGPPAFETSCAITSPSARADCARGESSICVAFRMLPSVVTVGLKPGVAVRTTLSFTMSYVMRTAIVDPLGSAIGVL